MQVHVSLEGLAAHSRDVESLAGRAQAAADAATHVASLNDAYGLWCLQVGLPFLFEPPQQEAATAVANCAKQLQKLSQDLTAAAEEYQRIDEEQQHAFAKILKELGEGKIGG